MLRARLWKAELHIGSYEPSKKDKALAKETADRHGTEQSRIRTTRLLVEKAAVDPYKKIETEAWTYHYDHTHPWKKGEAVLSQAEVPTYRATMDYYKECWTVAKNDFIAKWPQIVAAQREALGDTFNPKDYQSQEMIAYEFYWTLDIERLSQNERHLVIEEENETIRELDALAEQRASAREEAVVKGLWTRIFQPVAKLVERLGKADAVFRDSLIGNIKEILTLASTFQIDDPAFIKIKADLDNALQGIEPETLRDSRIMRDRTAKAGMLILREIGQIIGMDPEEEVRRIRLEMDSKPKKPRELAEPGRAVRAAVFGPQHPLRDGANLF